MLPPFQLAQLLLFQLFSAGQLGRQGLRTGNPTNQVKGFLWSLLWGWGEKTLKSIIF